MFPNQKGVQEMKPKFETFQEVALVVGCGRADIDSVIRT